MRNLALPVAAIFVTLAASAVGQMTTQKPQRATSQVMPDDLSYHIRTSDEAYLVLLDRLPIANLPDWRDRFSGQILGFGIRTPRKPLSDVDVVAAKTLLLDPASWGTEEKACLIAGDAALLMRGPKGEVTIMLELWCGRAHVRDDTGMCLTAYGQIDAVCKEFRALASKYFPDDEYLQNLAKGRR